MTSFTELLYGTDRASRKRLVDTIHDSMLNGCLIAEPHRPFTIRWLNEAFLQMLRCPLHSFQEFVGKSFLDIMPSEYRDWVATAQVQKLRRGSTGWFDLELIRCDQSVVPVVHNAILLERDANPYLVYGWVIDQSEILGYQAEIRELRDKLELTYSGGSVATRLTPTQLRIAREVRQGMTSKEIASHHGVALKTILNHRDNIRAALGLTGDPVGLAVLLQKYSL